jgi:hypothetical protein
MTLILAIPSTLCPALQSLPGDRPIPLFPIRTGTGVCTCLSLATPRQSVPLFCTSQVDLSTFVFAIPCHPFTYALNCTRSWVVCLSGFGWRRASTTFSTRLAPILCRLQLRARCTSGIWWIVCVRFYTSSGVLGQCGPLKCRFKQGCRAATPNPSYVCITLKLTPERWAD